MSDGKIFRENLKKAKLDLSEFLLMCREAGYFDLSEIEVAVFEHNGRLSVLPKSAHRPLTPSDVNIPVTAAHIGTELIMDGKMLGENLKRAGRDEKWLAKRLKDAGYTAKEIYLAIYKSADDSIELYPIEH